MGRLYAAGAGREHRRRRAVRARSRPVTDHSLGAGWANPKRQVPSPLVRAGWLEKREHSDRRKRGAEKFVPVSWDEATTLVADEIRRVSTTYGNASIFAGSYGWTNSGRLHHASSLLKRMLNLVGGFTRHVDTYSIAAGPVILRHTLGSSDACDGRANTLDTIAEHTETLVVFGALSPRTAQTEAGGIGVHRVESYLRKIADRGIRIVHVSPLKDDLPEWVDAEWWPIRPNTDAALMLGLAGEIVLAGRHARDFLDRCTSGADQLIAYLDGSADGIRKDATWAAEICGLDAESIRQLARRLVDTRSMLTVSWSLQRASRRTAVLVRARPRLDHRPDRPAGRRCRLWLCVARRRWLAVQYRQVAGDFAADAADRQLHSGGADQRHAAEPGRDLHL